LGNLAKGYPRISKVVVRPAKEARSSRRSRTDVLAGWDACELELIAQGRATKKDVEKLREKLIKSKSRIDLIITNLGVLRGALLKSPNGIAVVAQINGLIHENHNVGGITNKGGLRREVLSVLDSYDRVSKLKKNSKKASEHQEALATQALLLCNSIEAFNASVRRLHRFVFSD
jgi:hypothetical protein